MGLLDFYQSPDQQQMLGLVAGLLSAGGRSAQPVSLGQALSSGLLTGSQLAGQARQGQLQGLQAQTMTQSLEAQKRSQAAIEAMASQLPAEERGRFLVDPAGYIKSKTEGFTLSPGQTRYSGGQPIASSAPNLQFQDMGAGVQGLNPQTGAPVGSMLPKSVTPDAAARLGWDQYQFGNLSKFQENTLGIDRSRLGLDFSRLGLERERVGMDRDRLGLDRLNTFYNTGLGMPGQAPAVAPRLQQQLSMVGPTKAAEVKAAAQAQAALDLPTAQAKANQALQLVDQMIGTKGRELRPGEKEVAPHSGFSAAVGATWTPGARFVPGTEAANFQALYDQVKGGAFLQAFESLKGAGQITEVEGTKATQAITRMQLAQSEAEFIKAAREFQDSAKRGMELAKQRAGSQGQPRVVDW